jgi:hypothetical protein
MPVAIFIVSARPTMLRYILPALPLAVLGAARGWLALRCRFGRRPLASY